MKLRPYQEMISSEAARLLKDKGLCYLAMECRTGKTATALATAEKLGARLVLVLTKKKAIPSIEKDYNEMQPSFTLMVTNYESAHKCMGGYDLVILDEAHSLGAFPRPSQRQQMAKKLAEGAAVLFLSGTPTPESYAQMYHQMQVAGAASPWKMFPNFYKWARAGYVDVQQRMINGRPLNDYSHADEAKVMADIRPLMLTYTQEEAGFEADIMEHDVVVEMGEATAELFKDLRRHKVATLAGGETVVGDTPAALLNKLHQISGGTVITEDGKAVPLDIGKVRYIMQRWWGRHIAIFYTYKAEGDMLRSYLGGMCTEVPEVFQADPSKVFVGQVRSAREGTRLDTAEALVFYSMEYSYLSYEQARQRAISKERKEQVPIFYLCSDFGLDGKILEAVRDKQDFTLSYYFKSVRCDG